MPEIPLTGLGSNDIVPGVYAEIVFGVGPSSSGSTTYSAIIIANKLSTGAGSDNVIYGPDTATEMTSESDAIALFGDGSEAHRMVRRFLKVNQSTPLYAICPAESAGAKADGYVTFSTTATGNGTVRFYVGDEFVDSSIVSGDTVTTIAAAAVVAINSRTHWGVTATSNLGAVTVTAKQKGLRGNQIRIMARILGSGVGTTSDVTVMTNLTQGTTADDNTAVLATLLTRRFYYTISAAIDSTQVGALKSQAETKALPINGIYERVFSGSADTAANAITFATSLNSPRAEVVWLAQSDVVPSELAAMGAARFALEEVAWGGNSKALNFNGIDIGVNAPLSQAAPTRSQIVSALNNGITPLGVRQDGSTYVVKRITSKSSTSSLADYKTRDAHIVTVADRYTDDLKIKIASQFPNKLIGDDPADNETVGPDVVTPRVLKAAINRLTQEYGENALLQQVADIKLATQVVRSVSVPTRMSARVPLRVIDVLDQVTLKIDQVTQIG